MDLFIWILYKNGIDIYFDKASKYLFFYQRDFTYLTHISQSFHIVTCTNDSWQVNMITKEFKCVVVLVILGDIVAKKGFSLVKKYLLHP